MNITAVPITASLTGAATITAELVGEDAGGEPLDSLFDESGIWTASGIWTSGFIWPE